ncbi:MAG: PD-(D/E)XK nuclease family protein [Bacteroidaceae bacterium]|nr:PD-(D/E)XK nuclease family protein [Bacteroidaceae bacterium]
MTPFLKIVADDLYKKLGGDFEQTTIIFPNKRASLFFNQYLWENANGRTIWTPEYTTISELFSSLSDYTVADTIMLVVQLWEVYQQKMQPTKSFDQLYGLMETMLSDFQDIDNNMVDVSKLFLNIADLKELTDFSFLEKQQREAIEQFFGKFFVENNGKTPLKKQFKTLWNHLQDIYETYQKELLDTKDGEPMVYEGMMKRQVIETLTGKDDEKRRRSDSRLSAQTYVMVGFNVLNKTEMELFRYLKQHRHAMFYWDYDKSYMKHGRNGILSKYEAGQFIEENIHHLGDELKGEDFFQNMCIPKHITFIQSPTENAQTRHIAPWIKEHVHSNEPQTESAVILCNESLLQPVLHSIPPTDTNEERPVNVTMGYPLVDTPAFSLIHTLLELQMHGHTHGYTWRYKYVATVLKHPFMQKLLGEKSHQKLQELTNKKILFPNKEHFADEPIMQRIFTPVSGQELTSYLSGIISMVGHCYQDAFVSHDFTLQIHKESLFVAYTLVNRMATLQETHTSLHVSDEMLSRLMLQLMRQATIPFHGEPAIGLQVMGLLETRNLDFCNVIMLSVNEGQLPKGDKRASLIPYTLRAAYGMTTIEREVSLYAYYYYRLLQRAQHITLLYNTSTDGIGTGKGEMSRFMLQTLVEKDELFAHGQEIHLKVFTAASETTAPPPISVKKDEDVMLRLQQRFTSPKILSPSALITYIKCPLQFYFNYVEGIRPPKDLTDDIDSPLFGTIFHDAMHHLYLPWEGRTISSSDVRALAQNGDLILQSINNAIAVNLFSQPEIDSQGNTVNYDKLSLNGTQLISRYVITQFILNQLQADATIAEQLEAKGGHWEIVSQEKSYITQHSTLCTPLSNLQLGGIIDRLDLLVSPQGNRLRIVDYKTSSKPHTASTLDELFNSDTCTNNYHIFQVLYYCHVLTQLSTANTQFSSSIVPALMYCTKSTTSPSGIVKLTPPDHGKKTEIEDYRTQYENDFNQLLTTLIDEIFTPYAEDNPHGTFTQCTNLQHCTHCDFITLCQRHPS